MQYKPIRAIISGGGTGGHIFPAISIANQLMQCNPDTEILFVGAEGKMEMEKVPAAGYRIVGLPIVGMQRKLTLKNIANDLLIPFKVASSIRRARSIIKEFKPDVVVGVGGYGHAYPGGNPGAERLCRAHQQTAGQPGAVHLRGL